MRRETIDTETIGQPSSGRHPALLAATRLMLVGSMALAASACSDTSLVALGDRSTDWIGEAAVATDVIPAPVPVDVPEALVWANDSLGVPSAPEPDQVLTGVVDRAAKGDRFVQASRFEIARVLPGVAFPRRVPKGVEAITSQLIVSTAGDRLDDEDYATFGLWTVEPYTKSRSVGQRGVLTIGPSSESPACGRLVEPSVGSCSEVDIDGLRASRFDGESGQTWVWSDARYEYRLFLRGSAETNRSEVEAMTATLVALADLPIDDDVRVLGNQVSASEG